MNVTVTLTFASAAAAAAFLATADGAPAAATAETPKDKPADKPKADKPADKPAAEKPKDTPAVDPNKAYLDSGIPERIQKLVAKDRAAAKALLAKFGAAKGAELKAADHDKFKAEIDALLAPAEDLS